MIDNISSIINTAEIDFAELVAEIIISIQIALKIRAIMAFAIATPAFCGFSALLTAYPPAITL